MSCSICKGCCGSRRSVNRGVYVRMDEDIHNLGRQSVCRRWDGHGRSSRQSPQPLLHCSQQV